MNFIKVLMGLSLMTILHSANGSLPSNCPPLTVSSYMTQNNIGHSTYVDPDMGVFLASLQRSTKLDLNKPMLDIGAGYGAGTYELIKLGAKKVYVSELDQNNLDCMRRSIEKIAQKNNAEIIYLHGDISSESVLKEIPDHKINFIFIKNSIQFLSHHQLISVIKAFSQKTTKDGIVVIIYENPYMKQLDLLINGIFIQHHKYPNLNLDEIVKSAYQNFAFPGARHCSFDAYQKASKEQRLPGFPCELSLMNGNGQLLIPEIIIQLMKSAGFSYSLGDAIHNHEKAVLLVFRKAHEINNDQIDVNIEKWVKQQLSDSG